MIITTGQLISSSYFASLLHDGLVLAQVIDMPLRMVVWTVMRHLGVQLD